jgi:hypothetical protein
MFNVITAGSLPSNHDATILSQMRTGHKSKGGVAKFIAPPSVENHDTSPDSDFTLTIIEAHRGGGATVRICLAQNRRIAATGQMRHMSSSSETTVFNWK